MNINKYWKKNFLIDKKKLFKSSLTKKILLLRVNYALTSIIYLGLAFNFSFRINLQYDPADFFEPLSHFVVSLPYLLILLALRNQRYFLYKKDELLDNKYKVYKKQNFLYFFITIVLIGIEIKALLWSVNHPSFIFVPSFFKLILVVFLFLGLVNFLTIIKKFAKLGLRIPKYSESKLEKILNQSKLIIFSGKLEKNVFITIKWFLISNSCFMSLFFLGVLIAQFFGENEALITPLPPTIFQVAAVIFFLVCLIAFLIDSYLLWTNKSFEPVWNNLNTFWNLNLKYSPSVKIYKFIKKKLRNK